jgi:hypothetical protein
MSVIRFGVVALAASMVFGVGASRANITYNVNRTVGSGSVVGTITTDGATGVLGVGDIVSWDLLLTGNGGGTFDLTSPNNSYVSGADLTATHHLLLFNFSGGDGGRFLLQQGPEVGNTYYCVSTVYADCYAGETVVPANVFDGTAQNVAQSGNQIIGVNGRGVPEPGSWLMMLLGFGLIGGALRGFHKLDRELEELAG